MLEKTSTQIQAKPLSLKPVIFIDDTVLDGEFEIVRHVLTGFADMSFKTTVVCSSSKYCDFSGDGHYEMTTYPAYKLPFLGKQNMAILVNTLTEFKPDILHSFSSAKSRFISKLSYKLNVPYIVSVDKMGAKPFISKNCGRIICASESIYSNLAQKKYYKEKLELVNYATFVEDDITCFESLQKVTSMILVSDFKHFSRLEPLLNAIKHLAIDGYEFILFMIGSGPAELKIRRLIKVLGLSNIVNVVPPMNPLREIFREGDIFIQPEINQKFNPYLLEAMSVGMAVTGCQGGVDDLLIKDETAAIFDSDDELSIYSTIQELLDKREKTRQLAKNAQVNLRKNYSVSKMVDSLIKIYAQVKADFKSD